MATIQNGIPEGYHTLTPYLVVDDAEHALRFYQAAFGAVERSRYTDPSGIVRNVQFRIGNSMLMFSVRAPDGGLSDSKAGDMPRVSLYLYVADADRVFDQAIAHGATPLYRPEDQDYGNREGGLVDPFGVTWWIATALRRE